MLVRASCRGCIQCETRMQTKWKQHIGEHIERRNKFECLKHLSAARRTKVSPRRVARVRQINSINADRAARGR